MTTPGGVAYRWRQLHMRPGVVGHISAALARTVAGRAVVVALTFAATLGQLVALSHEMTVRHFRCAEHGDLTHVASLRFTSTTAEASTVPLRPEGEGPSVDGGGLAGADAHDHCSVALTLRGSAHAPVIRTAVRFSPPPSAVRRPAVVPLQPGRAFVLASAPKTSPPVV